MRPIPKKIDVTTSESDTPFGTGLTQALIKNIGSEDVTVDFDQATSSDSYVLEVGEALTVSFPFLRLYHKTASGTSTLHVIKIFQ